MAEKKNVKANVKKRPAGILILVSFFYLVAVLLLIGSITSFFFGERILEKIFTNMDPITDNPAPLPPAEFYQMANIFFGIMLLINSLIHFIIGRGLGRGKNWARIVVLIFSSFGLIATLTSFSILTMIGIVDALIIWYLGFNKEAKDYFN